MLNWLTKWLNVAQVTIELKGMRDQDAQKVKIAYAEEHFCYHHFYPTNIYTASARIYMLPS